TNTGQLMVINAAIPSWMHEVTSSYAGYPQAQDQSTFNGLTRSYTMALLFWNSQEEGE
ncbi:hypothetical protein HAX54_046923, partial [Datura stramonium]|nr:hypothetical protein [Datura stramonium]